MGSVISIEAMINLLNRHHFNMFVHNNEATSSCAHGETPQHAPRPYDDCTHSHPVSGTAYSESDTSTSLRETYEVSARDSSVVISEVFISPNQLASNETSDNMYGAIDWNSDGDYGKFSDQFIELWNTGSTLPMYPIGN